MHILSRPYISPSKKKSKVCFGMSSTSKAIASAQFDLPFRSSTPGCVQRELQLSGGDGKALGTVKVGFELRQISHDELYKRFDLLVADPDRYPHERDYLFPDKMPASTPEELACQINTTNIPVEEIEPSPVLLGKMSSDSPKARRRQGGKSETTKLLSDELSKVARVGHFFTGFANELTHVHICRS